MMALHEALRSVCLISSDWIYSVFWTIRLRPRVRGGNGFKIGDESDSLMLMWEDGFCGGGGRSEDLFWNQTLKVKILSEKNSARCPFGYTIMEKGG
ncbi:BnaC09g30270D [Brassica napus]|nr:unnamed protein product [Brassica napus]CDY20212.1 BnaC09g30270D [Brassica napus]